jgi:hypothetical protein
MTSAARNDEVPFRALKRRKVAQEDDAGDDDLSVTQIETDRNAVSSTRVCWGVRTGS